MLQNSNTHLFLSVILVKRAGTVRLSLFAKRIFRNGKCKKLSTCFFADAQLCCTFFSGFMMSFSTFGLLQVLFAEVFNVFRPRYFATALALLKSFPISGIAAQRHIILKLHSAVSAHRPAPDACAAVHPRRSSPRSWQGPAQ